MQELNLDAQSWAELNRLLDSLLDLPAAEREPWLEKLAPEHQAFKPRLRDLLSREPGSTAVTFSAPCPSSMSICTNFRRSIRGPIRHATRSDRID